LHASAALARNDPAAWIAAEAELRAPAPSGSIEIAPRRSLLLA
jgi:hypothetical protein